MIIHWILLNNKKINVKYVKFIEKPLKNKKLILSNNQLIKNKILKNKQIKNLIILVKDIVNKN